MCDWMRWIIDLLALSPRSGKNSSRRFGPAFEKYKGIGVRIEDDMLVTETGTRWMTAALPRKLKEIEAFMARARRVAN